MNRKCQIVKPCTIKSEIPSLWENIEVSIDETAQHKETESLVQVDRVLFREELLVDVFATAEERLLVLGINLNL